MFFYEIKWGDSIIRIANKYGILPSDIINTNKYLEFYIGNIILIPIDEKRKLGKLPTIKKDLLYYLRRHINKKQKSHYL